MGKGDVNLEISGEDSGLSAALAEARAAVQETATQMREHLESVSEGFETVKGTFEALAAVFVGNEIANQLGEVAERAEQLKNASANFNLSTTELQGLQAAAARTGVSSETLNTAMTTLQSRMAQAAEQGGSTAARFEALGITLDQMRDPSFSIIDALSQMGDAQNSNQALMAVLGARGAALIPLMRELAENHTLVADSARQVGALLPSEIEQMERYKSTVEVAGIEWTNFKTRLLGEAVPALEAMVGELESSAPAATRSVEALDPIGTTIEFIGEQVIAFIGQVKDVTDAVAGMAAIGSAAFGGLGSAIAYALEGQFGQAKSALTQAMTDIKSSWSAMWDSFDDNADEAGRRLNALKDAVEPLEEVKVSAQKISTPNALPDTSVKPLDMEDIDEALGRSMNKLEQQFDATQREIVASASESAKTRETIESDSYDRQISTVQNAYRTGQLSAEQELASVRGLLQQKWAAQEQYYDQLRALYATNQSELAKVDSEEAKAHDAYLMQLQKAQQTYTQEVSREWSALGNSMRNSFSQALTGIIDGTETMGQALRNIFNSIAMSVVESLAKMAAQWAIQHALALLFNKQEASSNAAVAATGAAKSAAQIPYIGWILAIPAAAAVFAAATGYSAESGFDIPSGLNPVTQLHQREMVLPQELADRVRNLTGDGGATHVHLHVHAIDGQSAHDFLMKNQDAVAKTMTSLVRKGKLRAQ
jgi:hypothetical protein